MIKLKECPEGLGWFATRDIPAYTLVIREECLQQKRMSGYIPDTPETFAKVHSLCHNPAAQDITRSVYQINAFGPGGTSIIYYRISRFNHSCLANCYYTIEDAESYVMSVFSMVPIKKGEQLTINYFGNFIIPHDRRHTRLMMSWGITCRCPLCTDYKDIYDTLLQRIMYAHMHAAHEDTTGITESIKDIHAIAQLLNLPKTHCILQEVIPIACHILYDIARNKPQGKVYARQLRRFNRRVCKRRSRNYF